MTLPTPDERAVADWAAWAEHKQRSVRLITEPVTAAVGEADSISLDEWRAVFEDPDAMAAAQQKITELRAASERRLKQVADSLSSPALDEPRAERASRPARPSAQQHPYPTRPPQQGIQP